MILSTPFFSSAWTYGNETERGTMSDSRWWRGPGNRLIPVLLIESVRRTVGHVSRDKQGFYIVDPAAPDATGEEVVGVVWLKDANNYGLTEQEYASLEKMLLYDNTAGVHADWLEEAGFTDAAQALRQRFGG